ncbi:MAG TPA: amino acid adenylation domain-containing protein [Thermoanaerobaculia bacterium]|nr:amino acid adenylation domain-containing protein [Thermoanaerobaculia bacterium]
MTEVLQGFRLSPQQRRLWRLHEEGAPCRAQLVLRLDGELDRARLAAALGRVVARHEILRTGFERMPGVRLPVQRIGEVGGSAPETPALETPALETADLAPLAAGEQRAELQRRLGEDARPGAAALVPRAVLVALGERRHALLLGWPALCADGWSLRLLAGELVREYAEPNQGGGDDDEVLQYADAAEWQNELLEDEPAPEAQAYWRGLGLASLPLQAFPFAGRGEAGAVAGAVGTGAAGTGAEDTGAVDTVTVDLAADTRAGLEALAAAAGAPLPAVAAAAWALLLARRSGEDEVVLGRAADGRPHEDLRHGLGPFARCLPTRVGIDPRATLGTLAARLAATAREADGWQTSFDPEAPGAAGQGDGPLRLSTGFAWDEWAPETVVRDLRVAVLEQRVLGEPFAVELVCRRRGDGLAAALRFDPARCDAATAERLAAGWSALIADAVRRPQAAATTLALLGEAERRLVLEGFNDTARPLPGEARSGEALPDVSLSGGNLPEAGLHRRVEEQAARRPEAVALVAGEVTVPYGELDRRANRLAHHLRRLGVGPEVPVALALERGPNLVAALLAVLKAGGAALPLDLAAPGERLAFVLDDARARVLVSEERLLAALPAAASAGRAVVLLDRDAALLAAAPEDRPEVRVDPAGLAYVTYTSGTTGRPKGVLSTHGGAANYLDFVLREYGVGPDSVVLQVAAPFFDASIRDTLGPLAAGGRVVLPAEAEARDPRALLAALRRHGVDTVLGMVPTLFRELVRSVPEGELPWVPLATLVLSGEVLHRADGAAACRLFGPAVAVVNQYGPTECTMTSSFWRLPAAAGEGGPAPIGRPIQNVRFYVLDAGGAPLPVGVAGELAIAGAGVTRGYNRRPAATAERFLPDPFPGGTPGARLYRTGDLVRWGGGGELEFLGRRDRQVKVRGVRVELDEIEAVLAAHPAVREVAVVPVREALAAYWVPAGRDEPAPAALRELARRHLPEALVPSWFVALPGLPRTRTGKLDRAALPQPEQASASGGGDRPLGPVEALLATIWSRILGVEQIGPADDFFALGGHSLLAARLAARIQEAFRIELPLRTLFEDATLAGLARRVETALGAGERGAAPPLVPVGRRGRLPLSFAQQRLWFLQQLDPQSCAFNVPRALRLRGPLGATGAAALERALTEIVRRHEALRTSLREAGGEPFQVVEPARPVPLPRIDLGSVPEPVAAAESERLLRRWGRRAFDLAAGRLLRAALVHRDPAEHLLLFDIHHVVSDAWSMGVLTQELAVLYAAFSRGEPSPLPALPVQYADYAAWQRRWLTGDVLEGHLAYWRRRLATPPPELQLPFARPRPERPSYGGAQHSFRLTAELTRALRDLGRAEGATLFMVLAAAFKALLHRYTGVEDVAIGTDVANRNRVETERLIGFFVNVLVLRTDLAGDPTFRDLLAREREVAVGAFTHQELPFERLVEELQPERTAGRAPLFQYLLVLQNPDRRRLELPGLELEALEIDNRTVKFDLVLVLVETGDGLEATWKYSTDLFDAPGIRTLTRHLTTLLASVAERPGARLSQLEHLAESERKQDVTEKKQRKQADFAKFMNVEPAAVQLSRSRLVEMEPLPGVPGAAAPLMVRPAAEAVDLAEWVAGNHEVLEARLHEHGAVLFRGFGVDTAERFEAVAKAVAGELFDEYGDLPHDAVTGKVYTSTPYPPDRTIWFHNESSQLDSWPLRQLFLCVQPALEGGETPLVDCRRIYELLDAEVRDRFERLGVMYVRNYTPGLDVDWRDFFHTSDRAEVEAWCRRSDIACEWKADGGLRTRKVCPAVARHPRTGAKVFFNQIQAHHIACLPEEDRGPLLELFAVEDLPRHVYFGDGSPIPDELVLEIVELYRRNAVTFPWQKGDLVLVDNMLTAHGRYPFAGPRKILVAMGDMVSVDTVRCAELHHASA